MDFLGIIKGALGVIGDVTGIGILKDASKAIETIPPEQQAAVQTALMKHQETMESLSVDRMKAVLAEATAEVSSSDHYTSRARPTCVYAACIITAAMAVAMIFSIKLDTGAVATIIAPLWTYAGFYAWNRTQEKIA